ncbi:MAG TPA: hypothetical protein VGC34_10265 [Steroidobacteraceae bacterium]
MKYTNIRTSGLRFGALRWLAVTALALSMPALAARGDYTKENVANPTCDKRCLMEDLNLILNAIGNNAPTGLPIATNAKITSDGVPGKLESSPVWGPARRIPYRLVFTDPVTESAVFYGVVTNSYERPAGAAARRPNPEGAGNDWWYYVLRIKVVNKMITEVEQLDLVPRPDFGADAIRAMHQPDRIWDEVLPESERSTREQLFTVADKYWDSVSKRIKTQEVPWGPGCQRLESGVVTSDSANFQWSCGNGMQQPSVFWNVQNQRYYIADVERGVVLGFAVFMTPP